MSSSRKTQQNMSAQPTSTGQKTGTRVAARASIRRVSERVRTHAHQHVLADTHTNATRTYASTKVLLWLLEKRVSTRWFLSLAISFLSHTLSLSLSPSHTLSHTLTPSFSLALFLSHFFSFFFSLSLFVTLHLSLSHFLSLALHSLSFSHSLPPSHRPSPFTPGRYTLCFLRINHIIV